MKPSEFWAGDFGDEYIGRNHAVPMFRWLIYSRCVITPPLTGGSGNDLIDVVFSSHFAPRKRGFSFAQSRV